MITTISTDTGAPVVTGARLRAGKTNSGKGAARMIAQAVATARGAGVTGQILVRGDCAYGTSTVAAACRRAGAQFSLVLTKKPHCGRGHRLDSRGRLDPGQLPRRGPRPRHRGLGFGCRSRRTTYTAYTTMTPITARLIVRRVKDARFPDALFPVWRYHPFFTDSDEPVDAADITHRRHPIIETVFADLIDGPLAHMPSGRFGANSAWILCAAIAHNLLRATGVLAGAAHAVARGSTLRRRIVNIPARLARPQRRPILQLPSHWPWQHHWLALWRNIIGTSPPATATA